MSPQTDSMPSVYRAISCFNKHVLSHALYNIPFPIPFCYFSFCMSPSLAWPFASVGLPCAGPGCPSFGQTALGPFSRLRDSCHIARLGLLLAFSTGHPPFCRSLLHFSVPVGTPGRGLLLFFCPIFLCSISGRSFSHRLTPRTRPFSAWRLCFSTFRPCFSVSFFPTRPFLPSSLLRGFFLDPPLSFSRLLVFFFFFSPVLFVFSGFFTTRSFPSGLLSGFQAVLAPSLWRLGFIRPFFCAYRPSSGFRLVLSLSLPATSFVRGLSRSCFLLPGYLRLH